MPRIRRWHPVSHDLNRDREFQALLKFHDRMGYVWLEMLAEADKNEGRVQGTLREIAEDLGWIISKKRPIWGGRKILEAFPFMLEKGWIIDTGKGHLLTRNYASYHRTREHKKSHEEFQQAPPEPSEPSLRTKNLIIRKQATEVLNFLNEKTGRSYRAMDKEGPTASLKMIMARLSNGATVENCRGVIARKARKWKDDPKMQEFLRPATLFRKTNFEQYLGEREGE